MDMRTSVSNLKAKIGRYMKAVRNGQEVVVTDRDEPVAKLVPLRVGPSSAVVVAFARNANAAPFGSRPVTKRRHDFDVVAMLRSERDAR